MIVDAPKVISALASPSSVPPRRTDEVATLHAESTTVRGIVRQRSRSYTVSGPSASDRVENSGLSARYEPWHARWARRLRPEGLQGRVGGGGGAEEHRRPVVQRGDRLDLRPARPVAPGRRRAERRAGGLATRPPRLATAQPINDGETETGRPESPGSARPRQAVQGASGHDDQWPLRPPHPRRARGGRRAARPSSSSVARAAAFDAAEPWTRLSRWMANAHASMSSARPASRAQLVQPRPAADDGDRVRAGRRRRRTRAARDRRARRWRRPRRPTSHHRPPSPAACGRGSRARARPGGGAGRRRPHRRRSPPAGPRSRHEARRAARRAHRRSAASPAAPAKASGASPRPDRAAPAGGDRRPPAAYRARRAPPRGRRRTCGTRGRPGWSGSSATTRSPRRTAARARRRSHRASASSPRARYAAARSPAGRSATTRRPPSTSAARSTSPAPRNSCPARTRARGRLAGPPELVEPA